MEIIKAVEKGMGMDHAEHIGRILVVDDETNLRRTLQLFLEKAGHTVNTAASGAIALEKLQQSHYDIAFLDLNMPGMGGLEIMGQIRDAYPDLAILILTAHASLESAIEAVRSGARDYLVKPLDPPYIIRRVAELLDELHQPQRRRELVGQIQSLLQEIQELDGEAVPSVNPLAAVGPANDARFLRRGPFSLDLHARHASLSGQYLDLTPTTFDYLATLAKHFPNAVTYEDLVKESQGYSVVQSEAREMCRWHIHQLRKIVDGADETFQYVVTVRGVGYRLAIP